MSYQQALEKAWGSVSGFPHNVETLAVTLLSDTYTVDIKNKTVFSYSCNIPAKEYVSIILLHYLARKLELKNLPPPSGEWINFKELEGGEGYYPAFRKRTIDTVLKKYGDTPESLLKVSDRIPCEKGDRRGDVGIIVHALEFVPILITISKADEEFGPDANILFDKTISRIFCMEDVVVLTEIVTHSL